jgi:hypothetical protein
MSGIKFEAWPSTPRLYRGMVITEKIDGTNAAVVITEDGDFACQSRKRLITPGDDNQGFAAWAYSKREELTAFLGPGRHFGEWWGKGIQRGYGMDRKVFSLFNSHRWGPSRDGWDERPDGLEVVPTLYRGHFDLGTVEAAKKMLKDFGSIAAPGFMDPEGVIVWHPASGAKFKTTFDKFDREGGKSWQAA